MRADERITVRFDGGSRGNPGPAAIAYVLETDDGTAIQSQGQFIGQATNNVAEYRALILGLEAARKLGVKKLRVLGDSELVIKQLLGEYKVRNEALKPLYEKAQAELRGFALPEIGHNRRGHNTLADALANLAMDRKGSVTEADLAAGGVSDSPAQSKPEAEAFECPRCGCQIVVEVPGEVPADPKPFRCRCGTPMRNQEK